jgi:glycosyltransferase involved in cell wall biosynthesis
MKILYHHRTRSADAQGIHISEMVKAFRELGHSVELVELVRAGGARAEKKVAYKWEWLMRCIHRCVYEMLSVVYNLFGYWMICRRIRLTKPDFIYERYSLNTFCGIWASRRFKIPLVLEVNLPLFYEFSRFKKLTFKQLTRISERWICSHSTWTIVVSSAMKDYFVGEGVPGAKMVVMPNGVDPKLFNPDVSGRAVRERFKLSADIVIGFVGWFREWHGLETLLKLMGEMDLGKRGVRLLLLGDGPAYNKLYRYALDNDLLSTVIFAGPIPRPEVPSFIAAMDIAVLPKTNDYGCPMKVIEYMAMGKCIVAPDQPVIRELVEERISARLFNPDEPEDFKKALLETISDPLLRTSLGDKAYDTVRRRSYLWSTNAAQTLNLVFGKQAISNVVGDRSRSSAAELS